MQKIKNGLVILLGLLLLPIICIGQNITFDLEDVNTCTSTAEVNITTFETTELTSIQFSITWDDPGLSYASFSNLIFAGTGSSQVLPGASNTLNFFWFWDGTNTVTLSPNDVLLTLNFNVTGTVGDVHNISFCDPGCTFGMEARGLNSLLYNSIPNAGSVTVGSNVPSITCPTNIMINNDPGSCGAIASWTTPTVVDCDNNTTDTPVSIPASGTMFPIGTTPVDITVEDQDGNMTSCTFNVTVIDNEAPTISCPATSITVNVPQGTTSTTVTNNDLIPSTSDNCPGEILTYTRTGDTNDSGTGNTNGLNFNLGTTTVTYIVSDGTLSNTCSITVNVVEVTQNPITLAVIGTSVACDATSATAQIVIQEDVLISAANFTVEWDATGLTYQSIDNVLFPGGTFNFGPNPTEPHAVGNQLTFAFVDFAPFMINAGDVLFEIDFTVSGVDGDCFNVYFFDNPNPPPPAIVFSDPAFNSIPVNAIGDDICLTDLSPPVVTCPIDVTINCGDDQSVAANGNATATDDCDSNPAITSNDVFTAACGSSGIISRTFTAMDASGKTATCTQMITISDATPPTFDNQPSSIADINCGEALPIQETLTAMDDCGTATVVPSVDAFTPDDCAGYAVTYRWTATDNCGKTTVVTQTFNVLGDLQDPTFDNLPAPIADINCGDSFPIQETLTAMDDCGTAVVTPSVDTFTPDDCAGYSVTYRWTATDNCGKTSVVTQTFNVLGDLQDPTFDNLPSPIADINCGDAFPIQEVLTASDDCGSAIVVPSVDNFTADNCAGYAVTYRWIATDDCGKTTVAIQTFNVLGDLSNPSFDNQPAPIANINCGDAFPTQETLTASDDCGMATVVPSIDNFTADNCAGYAVTYRWVATDDCGKTSIATQTFNVLGDLSNPTFDSQPASIPDINCGDPFPTQEILTASDDCGSAVVVPSVDNFSPDNCAGYEVTYRWIATDDCGKTTIATQSFNVLGDLSNPTFDSQPTPIADLSCDESLPAQEILTASDDCGNATVVASIDGFVPDRCAGYSITHRWIATDDCGKTTEVIETFDVLPDTQNPTFMQPADITLSCEQDFTNTAITGNVQNALDDCSNSTELIISFADSLSGLTGCNGTGTVLRHWTVQDACGNVGPAQIQRIIIEDNTSPTVFCQDVTIQLDNLGMATLDPLNLNDGSFDNCSLNLSFSASQTKFTCADTGVNVIVLTVVDECNNSSTCLSNVTVEDNVAPTISCPSDTVLMVSGNATSLVVNDLAASAVDQCNAVSISYTSAGASSLTGMGDVSGSSFNLGTTTVTYTATDGNGTNTSCSFEVTVNGAVVIDCPIDTMVNVISGSCNAAVSDISLDVTSGASLVDTIFYELSGATTGSGPNDASGTLFNLGVTTVTYTVVDDMGNNILCSVLVTVNDNENPTITCPSDTIVATDPGSMSIAIFDIDATASDLCGNVTVEFDLIGATSNSGMSTASGSIFNEGVTTVIYTATDENGNTASCTFQVTVNSGGALDLVTCPSDTTLGTDSTFCGVQINNIAPLLLVPTADIASVTYQVTGATMLNGTDDASGESFNLGTSIIQYTVTSIQGVIDSCEFTVTVLDDDAPEIQCVTLDVFVNDPGECSRVVNNNLAPTVSDNCGVDSIAYTITGATSGMGIGDATGTTFNIGTSILTYTIFDATGNSNSCSVNVIVNDAEAPSGLICPNDTVILSDQGQNQISVNNIGIAGFGDNCGIDSTSYILSGNTIGTGLNDASGTFFNLGVTTVSYTVVDLSGNEITCSFTVTITDTQDGIICPAAQNVTAEAGSCQARIDDLTPVISIDSALIDSVTYLISGATELTGNGNASGAFFQVGSSTLTYYLYANGVLADNCQTNIVVSDDQDPIWNGCLSDVVLSVNSNCEAVFEWEAPMASDNCRIDQEILPTFMSGDAFPLGVTMVIYTAIDASGNSATCSFSITVEDNAAPTFVGPDDMTISTNPGSCFGTAAWVNPVASDDCTTIQNLSSNLDQQDDFPIGETEVIYTAIDLAGNSESYSFLVTVVDDEIPQITNCPPIDLVITPIGNCEVIATWTPPTATDNCGINSFTSTLNSGDTIAQNTTVFYFATDDSGNINQCQFDISIMDQTPPEWVSLPEDITIATTGSNCDTEYSWPEATATDDCGNVNITSSIPNGTNFSIGTPTTVTLTGTDNGGNTILHQFTVTVEDNIMPTPDCPQPIVIREDGLVLSDPSNLISTSTGAQNCAGVLLNLNQIEAEDNCDGTIVGIEQSGIDLSIPIQVGTYELVYQFDDMAGNSNNCLVNITIESLSQVIVIAQPGNAGCIGETIQLGTDNLLDQATLTWSGPDGFSSSIISPNITLGENSGGMYTATFTTANGCESTSTIEINVNEVPNISATSNSPVCNNDVELSGVNNGALNIASWEWTGPCNYSASGQDVSISNLDANCAGTYTLIATSSEGCTSNETVEIEISQLPTPTVTNDCNSVICLGESCLIIGTEFIQGVVSYEWTGDEELGLPANTDNNEIEIFPSTAGSFQLNYLVAVNGCSAEMVTQTITVLGGPVGMDDDYVVPYESEYQGSSVLDNDQIFTDYSISVVNPPNFGMLELENDGTFTYTPFDGFTGVDGFEYEICNNCGASVCERVSAIIRVEYDGECIVPTFISPNNDGKNDLLRILCLESGDYPNNELLIQNRYGDKVFEAAPYQNEWDGTWKGDSGKELPDGTYYFIFRKDDSSEPERGFITILR